MRRWMVLCALLLALPGQASAFARHEAFLLTIGPGKHLFTEFGHNALLLRDRTDGKTTAYNYGTFIWSEDLLAQYLSRRLDYFLSVSTLPNLLANYRGRTIWAQKLDLPDAAIDRLVAFLRENALPQNRSYRYDHFLDNCSTRIRDLLDRVTGGALRRAFFSEPSGSTIRKEVEAILGPHPHWRFGVSYILNGSTDRPASKWELHYLPKNLRDDIRGLSLVHPNGQRRPLVSDERLILLGIPEPVRVVRWPYAAAAAFFLIPLALGALLGADRLFGRVLAGLMLTLWGLVAGVGGVLLVFLWTTDVPSWQANANLLFTSPLHLLLVPLGLLMIFGRLGKRGSQWLRGLLWIFLAVGVGDLLAHLFGWARQGHVGLGLVAVAICALALTAVPPAEPRRPRRLRRSAG